MPATPRRNAVPAQAPQAGRRVALVLQGGGALGAYHLGAFQALATHGYQPDWVAGISIGAFNAAIIAGNDPEDRLDRLTAFWGAISWPDVPFGNLLPLRLLHNQLSNAEALAIGQPNFSRRGRSARISRATPRPPNSASTIPRRCWALCRNTPRSTGSTPAPPA